MREMLKEFEEKPSGDEHESRLDFISLSKKERRLEKKKKFKEELASLKGSSKIKYFIFYYKTVFAISFGSLVVLGILSYILLQSLKPVSISYAVVNCTDQETLNTEAFSSYIKALDLEKGYRMNGITDVVLDLSEYYNENSNKSVSPITTSFTMQCDNGYYDVVISDINGVKYCGVADIFYSPADILDSEVYDAISDKICKVPDCTGAYDEFAIDISDTAFAKSLNPGYKKVYVGFPGNSKRNISSVNRFIRYVFDL